jgi:uncharacterized protein (TIGR02268 family)
LIQPLRLSLALMLLWGTSARAESAPGGRIERTRTVTVARGPDEPLPEVHVAGDTPTVLLFSAPIQKKSLTFDESRIRIRDAGEFTIVLQAVTDLKEGEHYEIGVFFADGRAPSRAAFVLVTDPTEVDTRIDVLRPELPAAACPSDARPRTPLPEDFVLLGYVGDKGVSVVPIKGVKDEAQGLRANSGLFFRGKGWALVSVEIENLSIHRWTPREATFTRPLGPSLQARLVMDGDVMIEPREFGRALAVVDMPNLNADTSFSLELRGEDGRSLKIPEVRFPKAVMEGIQ